MAIAGVQRKERCILYTSLKKHAKSPCVQQFCCSATCRNLRRPKSVRLAGLNDGSGRCGVGVSLACHLFVALLERFPPCLLANNYCIYGKTLQFRFRAFLSFSWDITTGTAHVCQTHHIPLSICPFNGHVLGFIPNCQTRSNIKFVKISHYIPIVPSDISILNGYTPYWLVKTLWFRAWKPRPQVVAALAGCSSESEAEAVILQPLDVPRSFFNSGCWVILFSGQNPMQTQRLPYVVLICYAYVIYIYI